MSEGKFICTQSNEKWFAILLNFTLPEVERNFVFLPLTRNP